MTSARTAPLPSLWRAEHRLRAHGAQDNGTDTDGACVCRPFREPNPRCERPNGGELRFTTSLPRMLCLGDSIGHPSCASAAAALDGSLEVASFKTTRGKLLNCMSSRRMVRCVRSWLGPERWRLVAFNAGAWDLSTGHGACCDVGRSRLAAVVDNLRRVLTVILSRADLALWVTTTPAPETRACCRRWYAQPAHLPHRQLTVGYCNRDAEEQNALVAQMLRAMPPRLASRLQ